MARKYKGNGSIILIGFKGSGKTSVGKALARKLKRRFIDLDEVIIEINRHLKGKKQSIREIYKEYGKGYFRKRESQALKFLDEEIGIVLATGGGAVVLKKNRHIMKKIGTAIFLDVEPGLLFKRMLKRGIPPIIDRANPKKSFYALYRQRRTAYLKAANIVIGLQNEPIKEIVKKISALLGRVV
ncbi:AAA family ATPase [Candidatus Woesearchaeota archaeon]|nr:AAA family ATPase [Candidatus Woesearchaeota archaeon]